MKKVLLSAFLLCAVNLAFATHLRCGYISVIRESCASRSVFIIITVFTNTGSDTRFGEDGYLSFGDGQITPVEGKDATLRPDLGPNIGMVTVAVKHIYASTGTYLVSYIEPNRNGGVLNMEQSINTAFYTETKFDFASCPNSSQFLAPPIFSGSTNSELNFSLGASSPSDRLITYQMDRPFRDRGIPVVGYVQPTGMELNELTGLLSWNTQSLAAGEYNFAVVAFQWTIENEQYRIAGFVRIDFQVILTGDATATSPLYDNEELDEYNRLLVKPSEEKAIEIFFEPPSGTGTLEMFSELTSESVSFSVQEVAGDPGTFKGTLTITPQAEDERDQGYLITVRGKSSGSVTDRNYLVYTDDILEFPVITDPVTGTEKEIAQIDVFPNPFQQQLNVQVNRPGKSEAILYTAHGTLVKAKSFELETTLMLTELPAGVYICDVRRNNVSVKKIKLIKTK